MDKKIPENYQIEDFITDDSFINYHFRLNVEDEMYWNKWLDEHPNYTGLADAAREMLQTVTLSLPEKEFQVELQRIKTAINYREPVFPAKKPSGLFKPYPSANNIKSRTRKVLKFLLPSVVILAIGAYFLYQQYERPTARMLEKYNGTNAPVVFTLSDSTVITLAPQSNLRYPASFTENERNVYLDGEAQFHVKRDVDHPFKVYSGELVATVLGTIFNVKQIQGDSIVQVELLKGKLQVETMENSGAPKQTVILNPDERVVYNRQDKRLQKETWQSNNEQSSVAKDIQFQRDDFESIAEKFKTAFGVKLINQSNKTSWRFTGEFKNSTAKDIIENICIVKNVSYQVQGDTIFIK